MQPTRRQFQLQAAAGFALLGTTPARQPIQTPISPPAVASQARRWGR